MSGDKVSMTFEVQADAERMLEYAAEVYVLPDKHKALRCLLDYLARDANWDQIFTLIRCVRCKDSAGWKPPAG
jgi:hypothetical protein